MLWNCMNRHSLSKHFRVHGAVLNLFDKSPPLDMQTNIGGALVATQAVARQMSERGSGTILLTGGGLSLAPNPDYISLSIGKAGLRAMTLGMFESLKQKGIHIATVTVHTAVTPDSKEAEAVGEHFWQLHSQPVGKWTAEVKYPG